MNDVQKLLDIEEIKKVKSRYFQHLDSQNWDAYRDLFTEDLKSWHHDGEKEVGRDAYVAAVSDALKGVITVHHGHEPDIEITGPDSARGVWAMWGYGRFPDGLSTQEWGHYIETFRRCADGKWRIDTHRNRRILRVCADPEEAKRRIGDVGCPLFTTL
jgi:uncharacterized protein (TIGR02246 family)